MSSVLPPLQSSSPARTRRSPQILDWCLIDKNTLRGSFSACLPSGMILCGLMLHIKEGRPWIMIPGAPQLNKDGNVKRCSDGKPAYKTMVKFASKALYDDFQSLVLDELEQLGHI